MTKVYIFYFLFLLCGIGTAATITINNSGNNYVPNSVTITVGDAVNFVLSNNHDARQVSQATWNSNGNTPLNGGFQTNFGGGLVSASQLTIGTHYYVCTPHASIGMKGIIVVQSCVPSQPSAITGNTLPCAGNVYTYTAAPVAIATSYSWSIPSGWSGSSTSSVITVTAGASPGVFSVIATNTCGSSGTRTLTVNVNTSVPAPPGPVSGNTIVCVSSSNAYSVAPVNAAASYSWTNPPGWSGSSTANTINLVAGPNAGTILVSAINSCGASPPQSLFVSVSGTALPQPGPLSGNAFVCSGSVTSYSVPAVPGASGYNWSFPGSWSGTSSSNTITVTTGVSGTIYVSAVNFCGSSAPGTLQVIASATTPAIPAVISGSSAACSGLAYNYSVAPVAGALSYSWSFPGGWTTTASANAATVSPLYPGGNIVLTASNACGTSSQTLAVSAASAVPATPAGIMGATLVCRGDMGGYAVPNGIDSLNYSWTLPAGWQGISATGTIMTAIGNTGGTIAVTVSNACGASLPSLLTVSVQQIDAGVSASGVTLTANAGGAQYQWVNCNDSMKVIPGAVTREFVPAANGSYAVVVTIHGCSDTSACQSVVETGLQRWMQGDSRFIVRPNPFAGEFILHAPVGHVQYEIMDLSGRVVLAGRADDLETPVSAEELDNGIYFIRLSDATVSRKIVKIEK